MKREEEYTMIKKIKGEVDQLVTTALWLQTEIGKLPTKPSIVEKFFARKGPKAVADPVDPYTSKPMPVEVAPAPIPVAVAPPIPQAIPVTAAIEPGYVQRKGKVIPAVGKHAIELLPMPELLPTTPKVVANAWRPEPLLKLRNRAEAGKDPRVKRKYNIAANFTNIYREGKTIEEMCEILNIKSWKAYELRRHAWDTHTYGDLIQSAKARGNSSLNRKQGVAKAPKLRVKRQTTNPAKGATLADLSERIAEANSKPVVAPVTIPAPLVGPSTFASPSSLYINADTDLLGGFNASQLWTRYNALITGTPVNGDTLDSYNMDYAAVNMYLHGRSLDEISTQLCTDMKPLINSMTG